MATLLLRLAGPLQAWGTDSKYNVRRTGREPSKSGVIGLLASALGRSRDVPPDDLCALRFGVRVDQEGRFLRDFHTVRRKQRTKLTTDISHRDYLCDAVFVVGLESPDTAFIEQLVDALRRPVWPLFLGRRSCPPPPPLVLGISSDGLAEALSAVPWQISEWQQKRLLRRTGKELPPLRLVIDDEKASANCMDLPISFDPRCRLFSVRGIGERAPVAPIPTLTVEKEPPTDHDPLQEVR